MYIKITSSYPLIDDFCSHTHEKSLIQKPDIFAHFVWAIMSGRFCPWAIMSGNRSYGHASFTGIFTNTTAFDKLLCCDFILISPIYSPCKFVIEQLSNY